MTTRKTTKQAKVLAVLQTGTELSPKQIAARYRTGNPRAIIGHLREKMVGTNFGIDLKARSDSKGRIVRKYSLATL